MQTKEKNFENDIEAYLLNQGGYIKGNHDTYDKAKAIDMFEEGSVALNVLNILSLV